MSSSNVRKIKVALAGYFVVAVFLIAFRLVHSFKDFESQTAFFFAGIIALPLVIALIWDRLNKIKVGLVEIDLTEVTPSIDNALSTLLGSKSNGNKVSELGQLPENEPISKNNLILGNSLQPEILRQIKNATEKAEDAQLAEIDIGLGNSWWVTRFYLLAALAEDYTKISQLLLLETRNDRDRCFLGLATPTLTRQTLGAIYPILEKSYRAAYSNCFPDSKMQSTEFFKQVECVVEGFGMQLHNFKPEFLKQSDEAVLLEEGESEWVTKELLDRSLRLSPESQSVVWDGGSVTPFLLRQILDRSGQFVALIQKGQVKRVVDKMGIAINFANNVLKQNIK